MAEWMTIVTPRVLWVGVLVLLAAALFVLGAGMFRAWWRQRRQAQALARWMAWREGGNLGSDAEPAPAMSERLDQVVQEAAELGQRWEHGRFGDSLLAAEDKVLLDMCGFEHPGRARALFVFGRAWLAVGLPVLCWLLFGGPILGSELLGVMLVVFFGFGLGWMGPKWYLQRRRTRRQAAAAEELPLLVDLLRLLQGVGLSVDQSLYVIVNDFAAVMPTLGAELRLATDQYAHGRTREQSFQRLAKGFGNDDLAAICALIDQVDRHGGAVQEPLNQFAQRLREKRRLGLKEKVGKLTVKMTGVMVLTLLPALLIVTGGAGFLAVIRGLSRVGGAG